MVIAAQVKTTKKVREEIDKKPQIALANNKQYFNNKKILVIPNLLASGTLVFKVFQNSEFFNSYFVFQYIPLMNPTMFARKTKPRFLMAQWKSYDLKFILPRPERLVISTLNLNFLEASRFYPW